MKKIKYSIPELVSPAGDWPSLRSAIDAGADAVYFGIKELNMRRAAENFDKFRYPSASFNPGKRFKSSFRKIIFQFRYALPNILK